MIFNKPLHHDGQGGAMASPLCFRRWRAPPHAGRRQRQWAIINAAAADINAAMTSAFHTSPAADRSAPPGILLSPVRIKPIVLNHFA